MIRDGAPVRLRRPLRVGARPHAPPLRRQRLARRPAAARVAFDLRAVSKAATGTREELAREGMLTRAVRVEPAPRGGWSWAWTFDELGSPNTARSLRRYRAKRLREAPRRRPRHGRGPARDGRRARRGALRPDRLGVLALREAEAARATA